MWSDHNISNRAIWPGAKAKPVWYRLMRLAVFGTLLISLGGCYFFRKQGVDTEVEEEASGIVGESIGTPAGTANFDTLTEIYGITTTHPPAAIRPDPDIFVRQLLLQYRAQGATVARQIGSVEQYRLLLGGASQDFSVEPQQAYDATSLLANLKVAEEICRGLVDPNSNDHPGWSTILPYPATDSTNNLRFLAQRILGVRSADISAETMTSLQDILSSAGGSLSNGSYVLVCAALVVDARALLL